MHLHLHNGFIFGRGSEQTKTYHFLCEALFRAFTNSVHKNAHHGAPRHLLHTGLEPLDNGRIALSSGLCLES